MRVRFLHEGNHSSLILFFNGWGMDENVISHISPGAYDLVEVYNYTKLDCSLDIDELSRRYDELHLVAWSFGVFAAAAVFGSLKEYFHTTLAINGTLKPIDARYGIAPEIFEATLAGWGNEAVRQKFYRRMLGHASGANEFSYPERTVEHQQLELAALKEHFSDCRVDDEFYDRAILGRADRIFPHENQLAFYTPLPTRNTSLDLPHYPFAGVDNFQEILDWGHDLGHD